LITTSSLGLILKCYFNYAYDYINNLPKRRLSYPERIAQILPDFLAGFLPRTPIPHFKFVDETLPGALLSKNLLETMRNKQSCPEMISTLINGTTGIGPLLKINVLTQNCLHLGSKSFSHTFAILCKYHSVFKVRL